VKSAGPESSSASADPLIEIDPSFANAADYTILFSPGVANAVEPAVPERGPLGACGIAPAASQADTVYTHWELGATVPNARVIVGEPRWFAKIRILSFKTCSEAWRGSTIRRSS
jgi:hypothetical protein